MLRYASKFFCSLFSHKSGLGATSVPRDQWKRADELGRLNDLATAPKVLETQGLADLPRADDLVSHAD
ncbi:hypothetical protein GAO09_11545 [Rhizobiales bacterium RZME27]|uniref:Uncharacterized protein n=1 Tax=Endobacterium cereale TaxID=2663029 RepID=A0A6A8A7C1_9HYPH|nr:hypothetical protein [Endobacterium cereale]